MPPNLVFWSTEVAGNVCALFLRRSMDHLTTNDVEDLASVCNGAWRDSSPSPVLTRRTLFMRLFMVYEVQLRGCSEMGSFWCILLKLVWFTGFKIYWTGGRGGEFWSEFTCQAAARQIFQEWCSQQHFSLLTGGAQPDGLPVASWFSIFFFTKFIWSA